MSEKEVREELRNWMCCYPEHPCEECGTGHLLLAKDPDLVWLLRKIVALHKEARDKGPTAYSVVRCETLWEIKTELEKVVRLTDDGGYEYTE